MNRFPRLQEQQQTIVTSCDDTDDCNDDEASTAADSLNDDDDEVRQPQKPDDFFDEDADDEDEAYVYKHLRSGMLETINVLPERQKTESNSTPGNYNSDTGLAGAEMSSNHPNRKKLQALKPRNTDAVLSCPYCFHIVCMDCQRHTTYKNQYRAMFVMNIMVRWDMPLRYSNENRCLEPYHMQATTNSIENRSNVVCDFETDQIMSPLERSTIANKHVKKSDQSDFDANMDTGIYYTVCCANCQTTVAALNMTDEVYHFSGCLASA